MLSDPAVRRGIDRVGWLRGTDRNTERVVAKLLKQGAGALVALVGMVPYSAFAAYELYLAVSTFAGNPVGSLLYAIARFSGCIMLIYALWRLRQAGLRMRNANLA